MEEQYTGLILNKIVKKMPWLSTIPEKDLTDIVDSISEILSENHIDKLTGLQNSLALDEYLISIYKPISFIGIKLFFLNNINHISKIKGDEHIIKITNILKKINGIEKIYKVSGSKILIVLQEENINTVIEQLSTLEIEMESSNGIISNQKLPINIAILPNILDGVISKMEHIFMLGQKIGYYKAALNIELNEIDKIDYFIKLDNAIKQDRIIPFFQPILDTKTGKIEKYEGLFRVKCENGEFDMQNYYKYLQAGDKFKIDGIAYEMIKKIFIIASGEKDKSFSINLGLNDLLNDDLLKYILDNLKSSKIDDSSRITFEILESAWDQDCIEDNIDYIRILKSFGFKIAMDDFGVGNGSINILNRLLSERLIDYVKIDGSIIKRAIYQESIKKDIQYLVDKAHLYQVKLIAEYIENNDIANLCRFLGIDYLQGYNIGKPTELLQK